MDGVIKTTCLTLSFSRYSLSSQVLDASRITLDRKGVNIKNNMTNTIQFCMAVDTILIHQFAIKLIDLCNWIESLTSETP